jgi:hypothetical protein
VRAKLDDVFGGRTDGVPGINEIDGVLLVSSWFRRNKAERKRVIEVDKAREM